MIDNFRAIKPELPDEFAPSGPCIPGKRRLFVDVNGSFFPCERVNEQSDLMKIGSISEGFDADKTYVDYDRFLRTPNNFIFGTSNNLLYKSEE